MPASSYPFKNMVFEGGGVKGLAYVGALEVLEDKGILQNIERVGGTSAGAINAVLLGLGYTNDEIRERLSELDFNKFLDDSPGFFRDGIRLFRKFGWHKGDFFRGWIDGLIQEKAGRRNATFGHLKSLGHDKKFKDLYIVGTNLSTHYSKVFSCDHTPETAVADAVRISMSIPLLFAAMRNQEKEVFVDGGVLDNYPIKLFDRKKYIEDVDLKKNSLETDYYKKTNERLGLVGEEQNPYIYNRQTLGFRLDSKEEIDLFMEHKGPAVHKIDGFLDYAKALIGTIMDVQANQHLHSDDWHRTIYIDSLGVKTAQFDLDDETKEALVESGRCYTKAYFKWYDDPANKVINRPS